MSLSVAPGPEALPNLLHLAADAFNVNIFARSGMLSLKTLETLRTGPGYSGEGQDGWLEEMCQALERFGGLPGLKALELEFPGHDNKAENARWIEGFGKLCPNVERFWGDYEVGLTAVSRFTMSRGAHVHMILFRLPMRKFSRPTPT